MPRNGWDFFGFCLLKKINSSCWEAGKLESNYAIHHAHNQPLDFQPLSGDFLTIPHILITVLKSTVCKYSVILFCFLLESSFSVLSDDDSVSCLDFCW